MLPGEARWAPIQKHSLADVFYAQRVPNKALDALEETIEYAFR